jgi:hypothetical protein
MIIGWMLMALRPTGPYPVLVIHGEQGSAKTTLSRAIASLIDPRTPQLRGVPGSEHEMAIWAENAWVLGMDNLSTLSAAQSDLLCRVATGAGFGMRTLYSNKDQTLFEASRPVVLNGIPAEMVSRSDLTDRALMVELPPIPDNARLPEAEVLARFEQAKPSLLGGLLDAASCGLRNAGTFSIEGLPRMADFVLWVEACAPALGWERLQFRDLMLRVRLDADLHALGQWPVMPVLDRVVSQRVVVEGTLTEVLGRLQKARTGPEELHIGGWPKTGKGLSIELRRYAPALKRSGIKIEWAGHSNKGNKVRISRERAARPGRQVNNS